MYKQSEYGQATADGLCTYRRQVHGVEERKERHEDCHPKQPVRKLLRIHRQGQIACGLTDTGGEGDWRIIARRCEVDDEQPGLRQDKVG